MCCGTLFQAVLNFMYHGEVNLAQEDLNSFLQVAEDLRVKGRQTHSFTFIAQRLQGTGYRKKVNVTILLLKHDSIHLRKYSLISKVSIFDQIEIRRSQNVRVGAGFCAVIRIYGSADPEPKEIFTAPQHCWR
jgi:hypothetical protein